MENVGWRMFTVGKRLNYFPNIYFSRLNYCSNLSSSPTDLLSLLKDNQNINNKKNQQKTIENIKNLQQQSEKEINTENKKQLNTKTSTNTPINTLNIKLNNNEIKDENIKSKIDKISILHQIQDSSKTTKAILNELKTSKLLTEEKEIELLLEYLSNKQEYKKYKKEYFNYRKKGYIPSKEIYITFIKISCIVKESNNAWNAYNEMLLENYIPPNEIYLLLLNQCIEDNNINRVNILYKEQIVLNNKPTDEFLIVYISFLLKVKSKQGKILLEKYYKDATISDIKKFINTCYKSSQLQEILYLLKFWKESLVAQSNVETIQYLIEISDLINKHLPKQNITTKEI